jgi:hypothetical protein
MGMEDKRLDDMLKTHFSNRYTLDNRLILETKRKMFEKQNNQGNSLLIFIQVAMLILTFTIAAIVIVIIPGTLFFIPIYMAFIGLINIFVALLYSKSTIKRKAKVYV